jgi:hypothetical protein
MRGEEKKRKKGREEKRRQDKKEKRNEEGSNRTSKNLIGPSCCHMKLKLQFNTER